MTIGEYQIKAARTLDVSKPFNEQVHNCVYGLYGEGGEVVDTLKKMLFHKHPLNRVHLTEELGDVLWYITAIATLYNITLEDVMTTNVNKLLARYPDGFNTEASINRNN